MSIFADRLKECRKNINKTQRDVATDIGITESTYQKYELRKRKPTVETLIKLAGYYQVSTDYLLGCSDNPKRQ